MYDGHFCHGPHLYPLNPSISRFVRVCAGAMLIFCVLILWDVPDLCISSHPHTWADNQTLNLTCTPICACHPTHTHAGIAPGISVPGKTSSQQTYACWLETRFKSFGDAPHWWGGHTSIEAWWVEGPWLSKIVHLYLIFARRWYTC